MGDLLEGLEELFPGIKPWEDMMSLLSLGCH